MCVHFLLCNTRRKFRVKDFRGIFQFASLKPSRRIRFEYGRVAVIRRQYGKLKMLQRTRENFVDWLNSNNGIGLFILIGKAVDTKCSGKQQSNGSGNTVLEITVPFLSTRQRSEFLGRNGRGGLVATVLTIHNYSKHPGNRQIPRGVIHTTHLPNKVFFGNGEHILLNLLLITGLSASE